MSHRYAVSACVHPDETGWAAVIVTPESGSVYVKGKDGLIQAFQSEAAARVKAGEVLCSVLNGADPQRAYVKMKSPRAIKGKRTYVVSGRGSKRRAVEIADRIFSGLKPLGVRP